MMSNYTPGPWMMGYDEFGNVVVYKQGDGQEIASIFLSDYPEAEGKDSDERMEADGRLITAAPEMAESLWKLIVHCTNYAAYLKTLGPEFAEMHGRVQSEINEAAGIIRRIDGRE